MKSKTENHKILKVTKIEFYLIPMFNEKITEINGWNIVEVIKNWFTKRPIPMFHATRNYHHIVGSDYVREADIVDNVDLGEGMPLIINGEKDE